MSQFDEDQRRYEQDKANTGVVDHPAGVIDTAKDAGMGRASHPVDYDPGMGRASHPVDYDPGMGRASHPVDYAGIADTKRTFPSGATRDSDAGKLDYEGFLSPAALHMYAVYMDANRRMRDGSIRDSDNWQKGIPLTVYEKSLWRHHVSFWTKCRAGARSAAIVDACAMLFNVFGWLHEQLKDNSGKDGEEGIGG